MVMSKPDNTPAPMTSLASCTPLSLLAVLSRLLGQLRKEGPNVGRVADGKGESSGKVDDNF